MCKEEPCTRTPTLPARHGCVHAWRVEHVGGRLKLKTQLSRAVNADTLLTDADKQNVLRWRVVGATQHVSRIIYQK